MVEQGRGDSPGITDGPGAADETTACAVCGAPNSGGSRFCSRCGSAVGEESERIARAVRAAVPEAVDRVLRDNGRPVEPTERTMKWAMTLGFFIGLPVLMVAAILGFIGVKIYSDLNATLEKVTVARAALETSHKQLESSQSRGAQLTGDIEGATARIRKMIEEATTLDAELTRARARLAVIPQIEQRQRALEADLNDIKASAGRDGPGVARDKSGADPRAGATRRFETLISQYRRYLEDCGLPRPATVPEITTRGEEKGAVSYYVAGKNQIVVDQRLIDDEGMVLREFTHHYLGRVTPVGTPDREAYARWYALESTIAFYLPASFLKNPLVGAVAAKNLGQGSRYPFNLKSEKSVTEFRKLPKPQWPYAGAEILGAVLWSVRDAVGRETADGVLVKAWVEFAGSPSRSDVVDDFFRLYLARVRAALDASATAKVTSVLAERGVTIQ